MAAAAFFTDDLTLRVLAVTQGQWGERIAEHIGRFHPPSWTVKRWAAPRALPLVIDDPADFLPPTLPAATLILALGETPAEAQLIPDVARLSGAVAVIAPIDRNESLPPGLASQLQTWLTDMGIASVFPKPFCSLTETTFNQPPLGMVQLSWVTNHGIADLGLPPLSFNSLGTNATWSYSLVDSVAPTIVGGSGGEGGCLFQPV